MKKTTLYLFLSVVLFAGCGHEQQQDKNKNALPMIKYEQVKDWPKFPAGYVLGNPTGIGIDSHQHILVFQRAGRQWTDKFPDTTIAANTVLVLDKQTGNIISSWGGGLFIMPHGLAVDKDDNVWLTDVGLHQVFKFSHEGKLLMTLGEAKVAGCDSMHFNLPTDVAVAKDGSFYVSDGYGNSRVVKFSASGKYLFEWGKKGSAPGEFNLPHSITLDAKEQVYVADRENSRIQVFDANGKFLKMLDNGDKGHVYAVTMDQTNDALLSVDYLVIADTIIKGSDVIAFDPEGNPAARFGKSGSYDGPLCRYHDLAVDAEGTIYVGDILHHSLLKFKRVSR